MRQLDAPENLGSIHGHLLVATEEQIRFYRTFLDAKLKDPSVELGRLLGDPALEAHLCGFDVI